MKICAVIVTYNRLLFLQQTIAHTLALDFSQVIVINNASTDGTEAWLDSCEDERLTVVHLTENIGGSGGFSHGMAMARDSGTDWIVCYDDDAWPYADALEKFRALNHEDFDAGAAAVYYEDGTICEMNRPSWNPFWHGRKLLGVILGVMGIGNSRAAFHVNDAMYEGDNVAIDTCSFVGFFIRREWLACLPLPDARLFIYGDDILYTLSCSKAGARLLFLPTVKFTHACTTMERGEKLYHPLWKNYYHFRNLMLIYRLAAGAWFYLVWPIKYLQWRWYARRLQVSERSVYLRLLHAGVKDGLKHDLSKTHRAVQAFAAKDS